MNLAEMLLIACTSTMMFLSAFLASLFASDLWDRVLQRNFRQHIQRCLQLRMNENLLHALLRWWSILLVGGVCVLGFGCEAWPLAVTWALLFAGIPTFAMRGVIHRREFLLEGQLVSAARGLSNAVKAGLPVHQGLATIVPESQYPLRGILDQIVYHYEHGRPLAEVLKEARIRLNLEPFTLFCLAIEVSLERGGRVNHSLDRLAGSLQEWHRIRRKLESETASGRYAVLLLSLAPAVFFLLFWLSGTQAVTHFFTKFLGQCVFAAVALLIWAGNRWTSRIMKLELN
jgi:tight adherence protein B